MLVTTILLLQTMVELVYANRRMSIMLGQHAEHRCLKLQPQGHRTMVAETASLILLSQHDHGKYPVRLKAGRVTIRLHRLRHLHEAVAVVVVDQVHVREEEINLF